MRHRYIERTHRTFRISLGLLVTVWQATKIALTRKFTKKTRRTAHSWEFRAKGSRVRSLSLKMSQGLKNVQIWSRITEEASVVQKSMQVNAWLREHLTALC